MIIAYQKRKENSYVFCGGIFGFDGNSLVPHSITSTALCSSSDRSFNGDSSCVRFTQDDKTWLFEKYPKNCKSSPARSNNWILPYDSHFFGRDHNMPFILVKRK